MIVHSGSCNLFRYDENIKFVKSQLAPKIESIREDIVSQHADKWKEHFKLTVTKCTERICQCQCAVIVSRLVIL